MAKYIIGVDEVGRGPLAGPVAVGVSLVPVEFAWAEKLEGVTDSKKLSEKKRIAIAASAQQLKRAGELHYEVAMISAADIDTYGIVPSLKSALESAITQAVDKGSAHPIAPEDCLVKLDGGLTAPEQFTNQETIIKGDAKEPAIGLASIVAKVLRDRYMTELSEKPEFEPYNFAGHKGYGTKAHREAIAEHGFSGEHRRSFCRNIKLKHPEPEEDF